MLGAKRQRLILCFVLGVLLSSLLVACRTPVEPAGSTPRETAYPAARSPAPAASPTARPEPATAVPPTASAGTTPQGSSQPSPLGTEVDLSLTLLHTGQVHGEVLPCG